jgi:hypothetical protein
MDKGKYSKTELCIKQEIKYRASRAGYCDSLDINEQHQGATAKDNIKE